MKPNSDFVDYKSVFKSRMKKTSGSGKKSRKNSGKGKPAKQAAPVKRSSVLQFNDFFAGFELPAEVRPLGTGDNAPRKVIVKYVTEFSRKLHGVNGQFLPEEITTNNHKDPCGVLVADADAIRNKFISANNSVIAAILEKFVVEDVALIEESGGVAPLLCSVIGEFVRAVGRW
jgi:hypothetical protein